MKINIIIGPPCAGKTTYIKANAKKGDILVDLDLLALALGAETLHGATGAIKDIALRVRQTAVHKILDGVTKDSWVVHTNPPSATIKRYIDHDAIFTVLDPGKEECLQRAEDDDRPEGTKETIEQWYKSPPNIPEESEEDDKKICYNVIKASIKKSMYIKTKR